MILLPLYQQQRHQKDRHHSEFSSTIKEFINTYFNPSYLTDRLQELPQQFAHPQPRRWARIEWQSIDSTQITGIDTPLFLAILQGASDTEAPIRDYTHTSRQYLDAIHPQMAEFVGGRVDAVGNSQSKGMWELEECRHAPALIAIYERISGEKVRLNPKQARAYQPTDCPDADLYRHGLSRIFTEYGAACLYLWLIGHSTGTLRQVLEELLTDEINHLIKFWGFGIWLYPYPKGQRFIHGCRQLLPRRSAGGNLIKTYQRMLSVLHWQHWQLQHRWQIVTIFYLVITRLLAWHQSLTPVALEQIFGAVPVNTRSPNYN
ncbi:ferritin-like domain-containing protein [Chamaesiphon sp. OTE_8_metabat_110]|uniref:ferritin-like domain-containing protein n=1 Tax=Chamaesiphon sp. OTE_8_metabat_110 TaxID=2964696 RepID=UPI00286CEE45|nr:ferritin-like domain-containing protein [Chamaesiphon sp. OTE_8_metabat_110]